MPQRLDDDAKLNLATEIAATATAGLHPALEALEEIANLQTMCPLAAQIAVRGMGEVKDAICTEKAADHYSHVLDEALAGADYPDESPAARRARGLEPIRPAKHRRASDPDRLVVHVENGPVSADTLGAATDREWDCALGEGRS